MFHSDNFLNFFWSRNLKVPLIKKPHKNNQFKKTWLEYLIHS